jgi:hypothetical protein
MSSAGRGLSRQTMVSVGTSIVPPRPRPSPADTPGPSTAVTTPQVTASLHDFAVSLVTNLACTLNHRGQAPGGEWTFGSRPWAIWPCQAVHRGGLTTVSGISRPPVEKNYRDRGRECVMTVSGADRLGREVVTFLRAPNWPVSRQVLEAHTEILNDAGYFILSSLATDPVSAMKIYPGLDEKKALELMARHRLLVARCRQVGISQAFAELTP